MGWERRKNKLYYYVAQRVTDRVVKKYLGKGAAAQAAAKKDEENRAQRQEAAVALRKAQERVDEAMEPLLALCEETDLLIRASLLVRGFHNHRGEWRRTRDRKKSGRGTRAAERDDSCC